MLYRAHSATVKEVEGGEELWNNRAGLVRGLIFGSAAEILGSFTAFGAVAHL